MTTQQLFLKFSHGINWNAFLYVVYKSSFTLLSIALFTQLTTIDYATWANLNSLIFLSLLWIDCGLRKSIPRFCPEFARNHTAQRTFLRRVITFQLLLLCTITPFFILITSSTASALHLHSTSTLLSLSAAIFFLEGIVSLLRILFHAHFWHKQFNLLSVATILIEMLINLFLIIYAPTSSALLTGIIMSKAMSSLVIVLIGSHQLKALYHAEYNEHREAPCDQSALTAAFIKHSGIMWINTCIKSLSERNFLMPLLTHIIGPGQANLFKVAQDGALLLYRTVLKTIGTTDTSLLAYAEIAEDRKTAMTLAFKKLTTQIVALCLPLLGFLGLLSFHNESGTIGSCVFQTFLILTIGYLIEAMLSPYERVLEVKARYGLLLCAYIPYLCIIAFLYTYNVIPFIGLACSIALIQGVRLVSSLIMYYCARRNYQLSFPFEYLKRYIEDKAPVYLGVYVLILYSGVGKHMYQVVMNYINKSL